MILRLAFALTLSFYSLLGLAQDKVLVFGVVPQQSAATLAKLWGPMLAKVSQASGVSLRFSTAPNIPEFEKRVANGEYDIAYMNPYHFTVFNRKPGYQALAKAKDKVIKGIMVVRKDSTISSLEQLEGQTLAFPAPKAFAATLLTQGNLKAKGVSFQPKYVSSHDSVYQSVAKGLYPAGGGIVRTLDNMPDEVKDQLRVLWTSNGYTPHAVAYAPGTPVELVIRVEKALLALDQLPEGKALLEALNINGFEQAKNSDWDDVRALNIDTFIEANK